MAKSSRKTRKYTASRKRRTRQHVIAFQSTVYVEHFIAHAGYTSDRTSNDYGYDLILFTYDDEGYIENGQIFLQLKASDSFPEVSRDNCYSFQVDIRDYNLWRNEPMPVFFVFFDAIRRNAYWLYFQAYFSADRKREPHRNAKSVSVKIPKHNTINLRTIYYMREKKQKILGHLGGKIEHHD